VEGRQAITSKGAVYPEIFAPGPLEKAIHSMAPDTVDRLDCNLWLSAHRGAPQLITFTVLP
jgi:hypothetical protein